MKLTSLPDRPLELSELRDLDESGQFRAVLPAAAFDLSESDHVLVPAAVLVADVVVAVGYDDEAGWTRVERESAAGAEADLERQARSMNRRLRSWAEETDQAWAEPEGAGALLAAFED
ncbi:MAG: hypothetical protein ABEJ23_10305 [Haloarculaceae archaeon]